MHPLHQDLRIPDLFGEIAVAILSRVHVGLLELGVGLKSEAGLVLEAAEAGIVLVGVFVKALSQQVLAVVVLALVVVGLVAITGPNIAQLPGAWPDHLGKTGAEEADDASPMDKTDASVRFLVN